MDIQHLLDIIKTVGWILTGCERKLRIRQVDVATAAGFVLGHALYKAAVARRELRKP
jgi:hypothetical protein